MVYLIFAYDKYYPGGGTSDLMFQTRNFDKMMAKAKELGDRWGYVDVLQITPAGGVYDVDWVHGGAMLVAGDYPEA